jgi:hypothetical protein
LTTTENKHFSISNPSVILAGSITTSKLLSILPIKLSEANFVDWKYHLEVILSRFTAKKNWRCDPLRIIFSALLKQEWCGKSGRVINRQNLLLPNNSILPEGCFSNVLQIFHQTQPGTPLKIDSRVPSCLKTWELPFQKLLH